MSSKHSMNDGGGPQDNKRPRFAQAGELAEIFTQTHTGMIVRDNTEFLSKLGKLTLFTRPTQLGKSTFLALAEMVFSKDQEGVPSNIATSISQQERNGYVIRFDFLNVICPRTNFGWQKDLESTDTAFFDYIKEKIGDFLDDNPELKPLFAEPTTNRTAGNYLRLLSKAVAKFSNKKHFFMVLVDEYDQPLRDILFELLLHEPTKQDVVKYCPNYISFFHSCKVVGQMDVRNKVWVTGVVPIALDLISSFKPENLTFDEPLLDVVGLTQADVTNMLQQVDRVVPFANDEERSVVYKGIQDHANHLQFLTGKPLFHTRMVNELMKVIMDPGGRKTWLDKMSELPARVTLEDAPSAIYKLLQNSAHCRKIAKHLVSQRDILGTLNYKLNFVDVAKRDIKEDEYLTLLVHLGVASVHPNDSGEGHIFRATSRHFRSKYLEEMLGVTLTPLLKCDTLDGIYNHKELLQEFFETLPTSGMANMIRWAKHRAKNHILELQFQGFLIGSLYGYFLKDDVPVEVTQEDKLPSQLRTDVRLAMNSTMIVLELKQKPSVHAPPTGNEMNDHHCQLYDYVQEILAEKKYEIVAGFVVVMYANGTKFKIERTTHPNEPEGYAAWKAKRKKLENPSQ